MKRRKFNKLAQKHGLSKNAAKWCWAFFKHPSRCSTYAPTSGQGEAHTNLVNFVNGCDYDESC